jgi:hypothetical protein
MEAPEAYLRRFVVAMYEWELEAHRLSEEAMAGPHEVDPKRSDKANRRLMKILRRVFDSFVDGRADERGITYCTPPEYSPDEKILSVTKTRSGVEIITEQPPSEYVSHRFLYKLFQREGRWWLRNEKWVIDAEDGSRGEWFL